MNSVTEWWTVCCSRNNMRSVLKYSLDQKLNYIN